MNTRAATIVAAMIASMFFSASLSAAPEQVEQQADKNAAQQADQCLTSPRGYTPPGTRWRYRIEQSSGRHCWFLKDDAEKVAGKTSEHKTAEQKTAEPSTGTTEEPAPARPRKKQAATRTLSDARAELSSAPVEPDVRPAPVQSAPAPAASARVAERNQPSSGKSANMLAPAAAARWPDPITAAGPAANPPAAPAEQSTDARPASPPAKPQVMPRAVPPMPLSEKPLSTPMLITIIVGGLSVLGVMVSLLFAWIGSRRARRAPGVPMPPLEMPGQPRRPGDAYRERKRLRALKGGRRAA